MAKGSYRKLRLAVLEELEGHDAEWASQIRELRTSDPQGYRKELIKADVLLSARTGRPLTLSMRPKRFGGDEDPVLVRRVLALRRTLPELTRGMESPTVFGLPGPRVEDADRGGDDTWTQQRTPRFEETDRGSVDGWTQPRTPQMEHGDRGGVDGWKQGRSPGYDEPDRGPVDGWKQRRSPAFEAAAVSGRGVPVRGRAPEVSARPDEDSVPAPPTRQAEDRARMLGRPGEGPASPVRRKLGGAGGPAPSRAAGSAAAPAADLAVLAGSVAAVKSALATGELDAVLDALEQAELAGKARKGVLGAIQARR